MIKKCKTNRRPKAFRKMRAQPPYKKDRKTNFRYTNGKSGVYIIYKGGKPVYIGMSGYNVYKTMYRHFQSWEDDNQIRVTYKYLKGITCRVVLCSPARAKRLEKMLIVKYKPRDNPDKLFKFSPKAQDHKVYDEFLGEPVESCPF